MMFTQCALKKILDAHAFISAPTYTIAYSGGLDSHVLLHAMSELKKNNLDIKVQAVHINHQINPESHNWALHCEKICNALKIPIYIETVSIDLKPGDSLEENARNARYHCLKKYVDENTVLLTAHNSNDQAETFLLQALRGAGSKGLSAMPVKKAFGSSLLIRPLLSFSRDQLEKYAIENKLKWIEDDSNVDPRFRRNFLRHEIFPKLKHYWPAAVENFSRSARLLAEHEKIIDDIAKADFAFCQDSIDRVSIMKLLSLSPARQRLVLREWFHQNHFRMPNEKHLKQIQKDVLNAASDAHPIFSLGGVVIKRDRNILFFDN